MTVQLTSARKAVRFLVMSPTTRYVAADNVRNWTGPSRKQVTTKSSWIPMNVLARIQ
jgi:hypothetical protein